MRDSEQRIERLHYYLGLISPPDNLWIVEYGFAASLQELAWEPYDVTFVRAAMEQARLDIVLPSSRADALKALLAIHQYSKRRQPSKPTVVMRALFRIVPKHERIVIPLQE